MRKGSIWEAERTMSVGFWTFSVFWGGDGGCCCFHVLVAERITFDVYAGIAVHGFLIAANS